MAAYGAAAGRMGGGCLGPKWAESWVGYQKITGKMKRAAKIVWAENELGSTVEF
jgi:hypothetical protein